MKFANKFNKSTFNIDTTEFKYTKLSELYDNGKDTVHCISGLFVHHGKLGDSPIIIDEPNKLLVNIPSHLSETFREILADSEAVEAVKDGKVGYTIYSYESHGKTCYSITFVDL